MMSGKPFGRETGDPGKFHSVPISIMLPDVCVQAMQSESSPCQKVRLSAQERAWGALCFLVSLWPETQHEIFCSSIIQFFFSFFDPPRKNYYSGISSIFSVCWFSLQLLEKINHWLGPNFITAFELSISGCPPEPGGLSLAGGKCDLPRATEKDICGCWQTSSLWKLWCIWDEDSGLPHPTPEYHQWSHPSCPAVLNPRAASSTASGAESLCFPASIMTVTDFPAITVINNPVNKRHLGKQQFPLWLSLVQAGVPQLSLG